MEKPLLKSVTTKSKDGKNVRYSVEEISNGWVLTQDEDWKDSKGNYQYKTTKKFFTENPLDEKAIGFDSKIAKSALGEPDEDDV